MNKEVIKISDIFMNDEVAKMKPDEQFSRACSAHDQQCDFMRKEIGFLVSELSDIRHGGEPDLDQLSTIVEHMRQFMDGINDCTNTMAVIYLLRTEELEEKIREAHDLLNTKEWENDVLRGKYDDK